MFIFLSSRHLLNWWEFSSLLFSLYSESCLLLDNGYWLLTIAVERKQDASQDSAFKIEDAESLDPWKHDKLLPLVLFPLLVRSEITV